MEAQRVNEGRDPRRDKELAAPGTPTPQAIEKPSLLVRKSIAISLGHR